VLRRLAVVGVVVSSMTLAFAAAAAGQEPGGAPQLDPGALHRYYDPARNQHWVTPTAVSAGYAYELTLGYLLPGGGPGRHAIYGCLAGADDHFLSLDGNCEGQLQLGRYGYAYDSPPELPETVAVWRCVRPGIGHFASHDARCEGQTPEGRLGFLPARGVGLVRSYSAGANVHWVSAAPIPPSYTYEATLGYLLESPGAGRTALYSCRSGAADQFLSLDRGCEGHEPLGREGWLYATPPVVEETVPLYRCVRPGIGHFASHDPACEGQQPEGLLGHLRKRQPALHQYGNGATGTNWVTTGAPGAGYRYQRTLGFLVETGGSNLHAVHGCHTVPDDHFLSLDARCEGFTSEGRLGFAFDAPPGAEDTVALYRCIDLGRTHFASLDPNCEGHVTEARLGYVRTVEQGQPLPPACGPSAGTIEVTLGGRRRRVVRFGRGATLTGRALRPGGVPAAGADVRILEHTLPLVELGRTTAGPDGSFSFALPPGASRTLLAGFRSAPTDPALACSPTARLAVRAKARLRARPRALRAGRVVRFRGRVEGPLPPAGKLLDLQAFDGGRWRKFATARARPSGRFRAHYRFSRQARPRKYRFRVRVPRELGFPYIRGYSNTARVRVRR
jgi:hypothetical protein